ncbi:MAG: hypothetical protein ACOYJ6_02405 [Caulobacterales bacterium]
MTLPLRLGGRAELLNRLLILLDLLFDLLAFGIAFSDLAALQARLRLILLELLNVGIAIRGVDGDLDIAADIFDFAEHREQIVNGQHAVSELDDRRVCRERLHGHAGQHNAAAVWEDQHKIDIDHLNAEVAGRHIQLDRVVGPHLDDDERRGLGVVCIGHLGTPPEP